MQVLRKGRARREQEECKQGASNQKPTPIISCEWVFLWYGYVESYANLRVEPFLECESHRVILGINVSF